MNCPGLQDNWSLSGHAITPLVGQGTGNTDNWVIEKKKLNIMLGFSKLSSRKKKLPSFSPWEMSCEYRRTAGSEDMKTPHQLVSSLGNWEEETKAWIDLETQD